MASKTDIQTFKISQLKEIGKGNLDGNDMFIITDKDAKGNLFTRKVTLKQILDVISSNKDLIEALLADPQTDQSIQSKVTTKVDEALSSFTIDGGDAYHAYA